MTSTFVAEGQTAEYTNSSGSTIIGGSVVVMGDSLAVAAHDIPDGTTGVVYLEGEFQLPAVSAADIGQGQGVIWDADVGAFEDSAHSPASGDVSGAAYATKASGAGITSVHVKLANPGSVT